MTDSYDIGDMRTFTATFTDVAGTPTDPTTVSAQVRGPDGNTSSPAVANPGVGVYTIDYEFLIAGRHIINFLGDGAVNSAKEIEVWARHKGA